MVRYTTIVTALAMTILGMQAACARHPSAAMTLGQQLMIPAGLDSAQRQAWIVRQRAGCAGHLVMLADLGVFAVQCLPDSR
jgi:hypothetical protein